MHSNQEVKKAKSLNIYNFLSVVADGALRSGKFIIEEEVSTEVDTEEDELSISKNLSDEEVRYCFNAILNCFLFKSKI